MHVFTIGHSNHDAGAFLSLLRQYRVDAVADIRSQPFSRRFPHFRKAALQTQLEQAGVRYVFLGRELGARREEPECFVDGAVSFARVPALAAFRAGIDRVRQGAGRYRLALMCAEADPMSCHRAILVAPELRAAGLEVKHILADGSLLTHAELEKRLIAETGAGGDLFEDDPLTRAYAARARQMAYRRKR